MDALAKYNGLEHFLYGIVRGAGRWDYAPQENCSKIITIKKYF